MSWRSAEAAGIVYAERPGSGTRIVLLHGIGSRADGFAPLLAHLPDDAHVLAWNAPGYGGSTPLEGEAPTATDYAERLALWLDVAAPGPALVCGHSLGALIAAAFAARHPGRVLALTLASPAGGHGAAPGTLSDAARARIEDMDRLGPDAFAAARAARLLHEPAPEQLEAVRAQMAALDPAGHAQAAHMLASGRLAADAARLSVPTTFVVGTRDRITPPESARAIHVAIPPEHRGAFAEVPGAGHALAQQAPAALAAAIATERQTA